MTDILHAALNPPADSGLARILATSQQAGVVVRSSCRARSTTRTILSRSSGGMRLGGGDDDENR